MKKIYSLAITLVLFTSAYSQYYYVPYLNEGQNPGRINTDVEYPVGQGLPSGWSTILSGPQSSPAWSANQNVPFTFLFNGDTVSTYKVSSSGVLTFTTSATAVPSENNEALPANDIPDKSIMVWGVKLLANDNIVIKTFGQAPNRQQWIQFNSVSESNLNAGWTYWSIVLEETSNNIYIVDQRAACVLNGNLCNGNTKLTVGIQIDANTVVQVPSSPNVATSNSNAPEPDDNSYYKFGYGINLGNDIWLRTLEVPKVVATPKAPYPVTGELKNLGSATITSIELSYALDGETPIVATINGLSLKTGDVYNFTHPTSWTPSKVGKNLPFKIWISAINGTQDENNSNDTLIQIVDIYDNYVERAALHEVFTSSTCAPCRPGNVALHAILDNKPSSEYTLVKYQVYWPGLGDPYYTLEGGTRNTLYTNGSAPALSVDGREPIHPGTEYSSTLYDEFQDVPAFININANHKQWWMNFAIDVEIDPVADIPGNNKLFVAIVEKTTYNNVETNGETEFYNVMKKMVPNANGTTVGSLTKGVKKNYSLSYTFPGDYKLPENARNSQGQYTGININTEHSVEEAGDLAVVVWVQNMDNLQVHQSAMSGQTNVSIGEKEDNSLQVAVYPNPANHEAYLHVTLEKPAQVSYRVFNLMGKTVASTNLGNMASGEQWFPINVSELPAGIYLVETTTGEQRKTVKVTVAH